MARSVVPRQQGDLYQARFFWIEAARLFRPSTKVKRVGFEDESIPGFDDVTVYYDPSILDEYGNLTTGDFYQMKYHVDHKRAVTWRALMDPSFMGSKTRSLLQRLQAVQRELAPGGVGSRFHLVTPWGIDPNDEIRILVDNNGGAIRLEKLFDGTTGSSRMGEIRSAWQEHLGLESEDELRDIVRPLRIRAAYADQQKLIDDLSVALEAAGLAPLESDKRTHRYEELIQRLHHEARNVFTKDELLGICQQEGLVTASPPPDEHGLRVGVRSFIRGAEHLEDETDLLLDLLPYFNGRHVADPSLWDDTIFPELRRFLEQAAASDEPMFLRLDIHSSLAFAVGYCLDPKQGANVAVVQRLRRGRRIWHQEPNHAADYSQLWNWAEQDRDGNGDVALAVGVTHDVRQDVEEYVAKQLPSVGRILEATIQPMPNSTAVRDGGHALMLAQSLVAGIRQRRTHDERRNVLHLFLAAPNAFTCFFGQHARGLGRIVIYEFDFESGEPGAYNPALSFPPA